MDFVWSKCMTSRTIWTIQVLFIYWSLKIIHFGQQMSCQRRGICKSSFTTILVCDSTTVLSLSSNYTLSSVIHLSNVYLGIVEKDVVIFLHIWQRLLVFPLAPREICFIHLPFPCLSHFISPAISVDIPSFVCSNPSNLPALLIDLSWS